jgi:hypothetical protein
VTDLARQALELAEKATPGPWWKVTSAYDPERFYVEPEIGEAGEDSDAEFIAFAREALPILAARVLELEEGAS